MTKCFACDAEVHHTRVRDAWTSRARDAWTSDSQHVWVGACCKVKIERAGEDGYQPPKGGPKLYRKEHRTWPSKTQ